MSTRSDYTWTLDEDDGHLLWLHDTCPEYHESADHPNNINAFKIHILLEFLNYLKIIEYSKYYDHVYGIYLRRKDGK